MKKLTPGKVSPLPTSIAREIQRLKKFSIHISWKPRKIQSGSHSVETKANAPVMVSGNGAWRVAASCRKVLGEYLSSRQNLDHQISGRIKIESA